jgi:hypothetical protein
MATRFFSFLALSLSKGLFFVFSLTITAQETVNLVPNPSFEEFENGCPEEWHELPIGWSNWRGSCNSFSTCVEPQNLVDSLGWAPWTGFGTQWPADGESFCGFSAFSPSPSIDFPQPSFREYLGCELTEPMEIGTTYYVSFKVSTGFKGYYWVTWANSHIGAIFTTEEYTSNGNPMPIPNFAHVYTEEIIVDTVNWVTISGTLVADQAHTHMALGVFFEFDLLNTFQMLEGPNLGSYYFIDDVCVSPFPDCSIVSNTEQHLNVKDLHIFPNPASDHVQIKSNQPILSCNFYDSRGRLVGSWHPYTEFCSIGLEAYSEGMYTLEITTKDTKTKREKLLIVR